ncbi:hypothetical protein B5D80_13565 [Micromonospora wenchangensis]|uniref:Uncharacterized protein n=1 Tax=Micromonospora wenchangensis TaxID=1185415 RepID=A0A246RMJ8_9ACTN|nr:hypothetical protein [Micromonospora wenchangensis]OWV07830.1 hypothetical protein B5D80_13565 [Micromonospora wenchangensis]
MRRVVAVAALAATVAGCSAGPPPAPDPDPVEHVVTLTVEVVGGGGGLFGMAVTWGHSRLETQSATSLTWAWSHAVTLRYPDVERVWVSATPQVRPGVDERLAYAGGTPTLHCTILFGDRLVQDQSSISPTCEANLSASPPAGRAPTPARPSGGTAD